MKAFFKDAENNEDILVKEIETIELLKYPDMRYLRVEGKDYFISGSSLSEDAEQVAFYLRESK